MAKFASALENDPVLFSKTVLDFNPFNYQEKFLADKSKRIVICAGRQIGKSLISAAKALWFALTKPNTVTLIVSATMRQSMLMFDKILTYVESVEEVTSSVKRKTRTQVKFTNKSYIAALPCGRSGASLRGYTADLVILDEAAFIPEQVISEVVFPMLATTGGTVIMLSTPYDKSHIFYRAFNIETWSRYHFPTSVNPLVTKEFLDEQRKLYGELRYAQEYLAEFVDDQKSYFPMALLRPCIHSCASSKNCDYCSILSGKQPSGTLYAGYDPGGAQDPAALVVVRESPNHVLEVVMNRTFRVEGGTQSDPNLYSRISAEIADLHKKLKFKKLLVDSTGIGNPIIEQCKQLGLPAESYSISAKSREELLSNLRLALEQQKVVLPNEMGILTHLNCIESDRGPTGGHSFYHKSGTHDDLAYALALSLWAAKKSNARVYMSTNESGEWKTQT